MSSAALEFDPDEVDPLEALGEDLAGPDPEAGDDVRERFEAAGTRASHGRLADVAIWWAEVRGDAHAVAPQRILALGVADDVPLPDGTTRQALDPAAAQQGAAAADDPVEAAVAWGAATADDAADSGVELAVLALPLGLSGRALTGYLMGLDPVETNGWPPGPDPDDDAWMTEVEGVRDLQWRLRGLRGRPIAMVRRLEDLRLAAATGFLLRSAARRTPVVLDGPGAVTAGLLAARCSRVASRWWLPAEVGSAPLHRRGLESLHLTAVTGLELRVEDGTASAGALGLLGLAAGLLRRG